MQQFPASPESPPDLEPSDVEAEEGAMDAEDVYLDYLWGRDPES